MKALRVLSSFVVPAILLFAGCKNDSLPLQQNLPIDTASGNHSSQQLITDEVMKYNHSSYEIDLDNDSVPELHIYAEVVQTADLPSSSGQWSLKIRCREGSTVLVDSTYDVHVLYAGDPVGPGIHHPNFRWLFAGGLINAGWSRTYRDSVWQGRWAGVERGFAAVMFDRERRTHYGWVQMSIDKITGKLTVHDYAYNPSPGGAATMGMR